MQPHKPADRRSKGTSAILVIGGAVILLLASVVAFAVWTLSLETQRPGAPPSPEPAEPAPSTDTPAPTTVSLIAAILSTVIVGTALLLGIARLARWARQTALRGQALRDSTAPPDALDGAVPLGESAGSTRRGVVDRLIRRMKDPSDGSPHRRQVPSDPKGWLLLLAMVTLGLLLALGLWMVCRLAP